MVEIEIVGKIMTEFSCNVFLDTWTFLLTNYSLVKV